MQHNFGRRGSLLTLAALLTLAFWVRIAPLASAAWASALCSGYADCRAKGYSDSGYEAKAGTSYWYQDTGHNCTNYVAFRMIANGFGSRLSAGPFPNGGAAGFGPYFSARGYSPTGAPAVGAIAWFAAGVGGAGSNGHVAYVEQVFGDGSFMVSEDNYGGTFDWRRISPGSRAWPSGFIHLKDQADSRNVVGNGDMESGAWATLASGTNVANYKSGQVSGESARNGQKYLATNTPASGGSVYTDIPMSPTVPSTYCATAWVRTQYPATGARGNFTVWLMGGAYNDSGTARFTGLSNGTNWREISLCVQATTAHTAMRVQFYPDPNSPTLEIDDVDVH